MILYWQLIRSRVNFVIVWCRGIKGCSRRVGRCRALNWRIRLFEGLSSRRKRYFNSKEKLLLHRNKIKGITLRNGLVMQSFQIFIIKELQVHQMPFKDTEPLNKDSFHKYLQSQLIKYALFKTPTFTDQPRILIL